MATLREKMIKYRAEHNLSQAELAKKCELSLQTVNSVENELQKPSALTEAKILRIVEKED